MKTVKISDKYQVHCFNDKSSFDVKKGYVHVLSLTEIPERYGKTVEERFLRYIACSGSLINEINYIFAGESKEIPKGVITMINESNLKSTEGYRFKERIPFEDEQGIKYIDAIYCLHAVCKGFDWILKKYDG